MEFLSRLKHPVKIEKNGFSQSFVIEEVSLMELTGYLNMLDVGLPDDREEYRRVVVAGFLPLMIGQSDPHLIQLLSEILSFEDVFEIVGQFNAINGVTKIITQSLESGDETPKKKTIPWSEVCFDLSGHFGIMPDEIAKRFSLRQIEHFYGLLMKRKSDEFMFNAQIHGIKIESEPDEDVKNQREEDTWAKIREMKKMEG